MEDQTDTQPEKSLKRRNVLKTLGTSAGVLAVGGVGLGSAKDTKTSDNKPTLHEFNPSDPSEVEEAVRESTKFTSNKRFNDELNELPARQQSALADGLKIGEIESEATGDTEMLTQDEPIQPYAAPSVSVRSTGTSQAGVRVFDFVHHLNWRYNSSRITSASHYKSVNIHTPGWGFKGVITDRINTRTPRTKVSALEGKFKLCLTGNLGCVETRTPGSKITFHNSRSTVSKQI